MAKISDLIERDDRIAYFTTGKSISGRLYLRQPFDGLDAEISDALGLKCPEETLTQQQFKDDTNPNVIIEKFARTGDVSLLHGVNEPQWGVDLTESASDYLSAMNTVVKAQEAFDALPAKVRARFENDPAQLLGFLEDGNNRDEAVKLGLLKEDLSPAFAPSKGKKAGGKSDDAPDPDDKLGKIPDKSLKDKE